jgi:hypothetical protein
MKVFQIFQEVSPENLAKLFFRYREALAPDFECGRDNGSGGNSSWEVAPSNERKLLVATARLVLLELATGANASQTVAGQNAAKRADNSWRGGTEGKECGC